MDSIKKIGGNIVKTFQELTYAVRGFIIEDSKLVLVYRDVHFFNL